MPDIGFGEIVTIVVIALLVFGPDRLPKVAADAGRMLRQVRQMAANARADLVDAAGIENDAELSATMRDLRDLDPRRGFSGLLADEPTRSRTAPESRGLAEGTTSARPGAAGGGTTSGSAAAGSAATSGREQPGGAAGPPGPAGPLAPNIASAAGSAAPTAPPVVEAVPPVDPDWT